MSRTSACINGGAACAHVKLLTASCHAADTALASCCLSPSALITRKQCCGLLSRRRSPRQRALDGRPPSSKLGADAARGPGGGAREVREAAEREAEREREAARERARLLRADLEDPDSDEDEERWRRKPLAGRCDPVACAAVCPNRDWVLLCCVRCQFACFVRPLLGKPGRGRDPLPQPPLRKQSCFVPWEESVDERSRCY